MTSHMVNRLISSSLENCLSVYMDTGKQTDLLSDVPSVFEYGCNINPSVTVTVTVTDGACLTGDSELHVLCRAVV